MKKIFLATIMISMLCIKAQAQSDITISLSEELRDGIQYVKVSIKNNTNAQKILFTRASWNESGDGDYISDPVSYIILTGNPDTQETIETPKLIISNEIDYLKAKTKTSVNLNANSSYDIYYKLYGEKWGPVRAFRDRHKSTIKTLQAKIILAYLDVADEKGHKIELKSSIITLNQDN